MGGFGSGRKFGKTCTEDMGALDVRSLQRDGRLMPGSSCTLSWKRRGEVTATVRVAAETDRAWLEHQVRDKAGHWQELRYQVELCRTPCTYGGSRLWWKCPVPGCGRRVALLFAGQVFACRHCHKLAYRSQRETDGDRAGRRAGKIRERLGWVPGILHPAGGKPKHMRWATYWRLRAEHDADAMMALGAMHQWAEQHMGRVNRQIAKMGL